MPWKATAQVTEMEPLKPPREAMVMGSLAVPLALEMERLVSDGVRPIEVPVPVKATACSPNC